MSAASIRGSVLSWSCSGSSDAPISQVSKGPTVLPLCGGRGPPPVLPATHLGPPNFKDIPLLLLSTFFGEMYVYVCIFEDEMGKLWKKTRKLPTGSCALFFGGDEPGQKERTPNRSTGGCISQTSISKHSTGPAADSLSRALHQITRTRHRSRHTPTHSGIISKSHGTPERSSHDNSQPVSPTLSSPGGRASVPLGRMRQRPLPVLLEKFRSPKPLVLATTRCRLHHSLFPSTATRSSCDFPTSLTRTLHQLPPAAGLPSPGPA
ncbi:hypothetical protein TNCT_33251 [Trichonephila clavata]|uniref:Uncharacterized protein n=1 Tax=Trichonephila clavata TaxID=2740835 RepID=A0A8X6HYJ4_TRICU|nr:hypothetical protein TNCT_33251 [Trichonephila clavata]